MASAEQLYKTKTNQTVAGVPAGFDALLMADMARLAYSGVSEPLMFITTDDNRLAATHSALKFFAPDIEIITLPAWDCLPYDRVSPNGDIMAKRLFALSKLVKTKLKKPRIVITTISAASQRMPATSIVQKANFSAKIGDDVDQSKLSKFLVRNGYSRASQVMESGEFAVRGGLVDIFPSGAKEPSRLDFFGDTLDTIRRFDPLTQRTTSKATRITLSPVGEYMQDDASIQRFKRNYQNTFGPATGEDPLYEAISGGRKFGGAEHWLPLFHDHLETIFDYVPDGQLLLDHQIDEVFASRLEAITDYYEARREAYDLWKSEQKKRSAIGASSPYKPVTPDSLYLDKQDFDAITASRSAKYLTPFQLPASDQVSVFDARKGRDFGPERNQRDGNVYDHLADHVKALQGASKRVVFACYSAGSRDRLKGVLEDHGITALGLADTYQDIRTTNKALIALCVLPLESGFETDEMAIITEQDVLGDRLVRKARKLRKADNFLTEASALNPGDLVVHTSHGVGRFEGLETVRAGGAAHDCLLVTYHGGDRLFVPVENIEVLSRYGNESGDGLLDKLGGVAWQAKKARMKERIKEMAGELIKLAAKRALRKGERIEVPEGIYGEFAARFPYTETEDQLRAIEQVTQDLSSGQPMDRLVCGDVGFGKTEVALRAAFMATMAGYQVAIIAPTTLLARQHYKTFVDRFKGMPVRIGHLSRLVSQADQKATRDDMQSGQCDIVIGTHALLGKSIDFDRLGLLVIDEEQHFGVAHKERLKKLKAGVHVLTLTATPIPRTLQMAMSGLRELSIIATPPVDRLAVRTFVMPFDEIVVREALLREHYRGGQSFYVCPRIADLDAIQVFLREHVPEVRFITAHGQMSPSTIEDVMSAFYDGQYDVLLSTTIVESGIDIPSANTMIIHRADMFGLAQLYQLRGRVGRSKTRAYAYLTVPSNRILTENAEKRLQILQKLDTLGAGFTLASHDMDIRGAGNLLGDEQSGHIREVGVELYQKMLEEAVAEAKAGLGDGEESALEWSPQINVGATVMIPERYIPDLQQRMALYRRLADLETREDVDSFCAEMIDRFGPLPGEVKQLAAVMIIKGHCRRAGIDKLDAGPKGATISFRDDRFANPAGLIDFISKQKATAKLRPDHRLTYLTKMDKIGVRLNTVNKLVKNLAMIADA